MYIIFRVYDLLCNNELHSLHNCILLDEYQQELHSANDYLATFKHGIAVCPEYKKYMEYFLVPATGDWPTWFYTKKLIAQCTSENNHLLSIIPELGQFHVSLNMNEDVEIFSFLFSYLYKDLYGKDLPEKVKPFQISALVSSAMLAWLLIRPKVLQKFQLCKDVEFVAITYLLEEVLPIIFFQYSFFFRVGNLEE